MFLCCDESFPKSGWLMAVASSGLSIHACRDSERHRLYRFGQRKAFEFATMMPLLKRVYFVSVPLKLFYYPHTLQITIGSRPDRRRLAEAGSWFAARGET